VDSSDCDRLDEAADELHQLLKSSHLSSAALLVLANKQDLAGALSVSELSKRLRLDEVGSGRAWYIQPACARKGEGLYEGIEWLSNRILSSC
jgi:signal recognition particle receptor subunit beta